MESNMNSYQYGRRVNYWNERVANLIYSVRVHVDEKGR